MEQKRHMIMKKMQGMSLYNGKFIKNTKLENIPQYW